MCCVVLCCAVLCGVVVEVQAPPQGLAPLLPALCRRSTAVRPSRLRFHGPPSLATPLPGGSRGSEPETKHWWRITRRHPLWAGALVVNKKMFNRRCKCKACGFELPSQEGLPALLRNMGCVWGGGRGGHQTGYVQLLLEPPPPPPASCLRPSEWPRGPDAMVSIIGCASQAEAAVRNGPSVHTGYTSAHTLSPTHPPAHAGTRGEGVPFLLGKSPGSFCGTHSPQKLGAQSPGAPLPPLNRVSQKVVAHPPQTATVFCDSSCRRRSNLYPTPTAAARFCNGLLLPNRFPNRRQPRFPQYPVAFLSFKRRPDPHTAGVGVQHSNSAPPPPPYTHVHMRLCAQV